MKRIRIFAVRNFIEIMRDPVVYIFCIGFPVVMLGLFYLINRFTGGATPVFEPKSLVPGVMTFSFTFVMLLEVLQVTKDRSSAFLIRLFASPMRASEFILGYAIPCAVVGILQEIVCAAFGWLFALASGAEYFSFGACALLLPAMLPTLALCIFWGIFLGTALGEKSAPGICSVIISAAGILGGAWMPLDAMGGLETACRFLPFYPAVYLGRVITGAVHSVPDSAGNAVVYQFDRVAALGLIPVFLYLAAGLIFAILLFRKKRRIG